MRNDVGKQQGGPTGAAENHATAVDLIKEATRGGAIVAIFHDEEVEEAVADRLFEIGNQSTAMAVPAAAVAGTCD
ncbi:hypothetical protein NKH89_12525 [Mesorhizobium sp. M0923]|uniref:hypothetical protein n=1 Tax=unclassified Mesorhizobium TaxID=325217 RepID=UPI0003CFF44E|nr:hypothetical protein [Mesorhizobium sp. L48C026A00]ESZ05475.1 hypothetical protein X737_35765 [Mesorhizobium sp. L48C026A00]